MKTIVLAVIENRYNQILLMKKGRQWLLPGGRITDDFLEIGLFRKVYEEVGLEVLDFKLFLEEVIYIEKKKEKYNFKFFSATYKGSEILSISPWQRYKGLRGAHWFSKEIAKKINLTEIAKIGINN